jgi:hypothetical protein
MPASAGTGNGTGAGTVLPGPGAAVGSRAGWGCRVRGTGGGLGKPPSMVTCGPARRGLVSHYPLVAWKCCTARASKGPTFPQGAQESMTISAKDCAQGGLFQMEPERGDGTRTRIVHRLADEAFYFDNANFRARLGDFVGSACASVQTGPPSQFCVQVRPRVNIGNNVSADFVVRDSAQVAERVLQPACGLDFTNNLGLTETRDHCGGMSIWDVASGGRMGMVTGEDAVEVANSPTDCVQDCQAQNQVRGRLAVLGFPFPVAAGSKLTPRTSTDGLNAPLTP